MEKTSINLLQPELIPEQPLWTLQRVVALWVIVFVGMLMWFFITQWQVSSLSDEYASVSQQKQTLAQQQKTLEQKVAQNKASPALIEKLQTMKLLLTNKKNLHQQLTDVNSVYAAGFSSAMTELSTFHHNAISLSKISMNAEFVSFSGQAKNPESVPSWLSAFEQATFLSGHTFNHFSLEENENKLTEFVVSSNKSRKGGE